MLNNFSQLGSEAEAVSMLLANVARQVAQADRVCRAIQ
jgi:hypothetical protein